MGFLNTSVSSLLTAQRSLQTVSHNIANVNTPGYSRQRVELSARDAQFTGAGYFGKGVQLDAVNRVHSEFITEQLRVSTSNSNANETYLNLSQRIDTLLTNENTGLSENITSFFNSVQDVADLPSSINNRQVMVSEAESLVARFQFLQDRLDNISDDVRNQLSDSISEVNAITSSIADINTRIVNSLGSLEDQPPNDLLDQRDELLRQLSEFVAINSIEQADGSVNVFTGSGQALVLNNDPSTLRVSETYEGHFDISIVNSFGSSVVTQNITSGKLGGLLDFQNQMLEPTVNSLGRLAINLADSFNDQHILGVNLDGEVNNTFFNVASPEVIAFGSSVANVSSTITDPNQLTDSDYQLTYNGANNYSLIRLSDNTTTAINTGGASPFTTATIDGFNLTLIASPTVGEQYLIRPTVNGSSGISTNISDPRKIAASGALTAQEATDANGLATNTGTGSITQADISSVTGIPLASSITLTYVAATNQFTISAPPGGTLAYNAVTENNGKSFTIAAAGNATFTISGIPDDGDQFVISNNTSGEGDNRNAILLAQLQDSNTMLGSTASYQDAFGQLVVEIGSATRQTEVSNRALSTLLDQATQARESYSGVNLDEEAASLLELQQIYQASARLISTADQLFQSLIDAV